MLVASLERKCYYKCRGQSREEKGEEVLDPFPF